VICRDRMMRKLFCIIFELFNIIIAFNHIKNINSINKQHRKRSKLNNVTNSMMCSRDLHETTLHLKTKRPFIVPWNFAFDGDAIL